MSTHRTTIHSGHSAANVSRAIAAHTDTMTGLPGLITASLLTVIVVSAFVGGFSAMLLDDVLAPLALAIAAGFLGTLSAGVALNTLLAHTWVGEKLGTPIDILTIATVTSLLGSVAAQQLATAAGPVWSGVTGMLAGLISAVVMGLLLIAPHRETELVDDRR